MRESLWDGVNLAAFLAALFLVAILQEEAAQPCTPFQPAGLPSNGSPIGLDQLQAGEIRNSMLRTSLKAWRWMVIQRSL